MIWVGLAMTKIFADSNLGFGGEIVPVYWGYEANSIIGALRFTTKKLENGFCNRQGNPMRKNGTFIISLDFELNWGVHDVLPLEQYEENLLGTREAIDKMLSLFDDLGIRATWATVGMLFYQNKKELTDNLPSISPSYTNMEFSPYDKLGDYWRE